MNTATHHPPTADARLVGSLTTIVAVGLPIAAILTAEARNTEVAPGVVDWIFVALVAAVTISTFAVLVPWSLRGSSRRAIRAAMGLSGSALLLDPFFFWTMAPLAFGAAGAWLGLVQRASAGERRGLATVAIVVGVIAALGSVAGYVATS